MILSHSLRTVFLLKMDFFFFWRELLIGRFHTQQNMWEHPYPALWLLYWNHFCSLGSCRIMTLNHPPVFQSSRSTELSLWPHRRLLPVHSVLPTLFPTTCAVNDDVVQRYSSFLPLSGPWSPSHTDMLVSFLNLIPDFPLCSHDSGGSTLPTWTLCVCSASCLFSELDWKPVLLCSFIIFLLPSLTVLIADYS